MDLQIVLLSFYKCRFNDWGYHEVVGTLKPYHMLKNLFELIALKGSGTQKLWAQALVPGCKCSCPPLALMPEPHGKTFTT